MHSSNTLDPARLLKEVRAVSGLSQRTLAARTGTSQSVVARIESGQTSPTAHTLDRLLRAAGVRIEISVQPDGAFGERHALTLRERIGGTCRS